jgi:MFS family permease
VVAINETFPSAPRGRPVIYRMMIASALGLFGIGIALVPSWGRISAEVNHGSPWKVLALLAGPLMAILIAIPTYLREKSLTSQFRIENDVLVMGKKRRPLSGLVEVVRDPEVLKGAFKLWGNGGVGAIRGCFRSKRLGKFEAFLTDTEHAVVLRWPDRVVAVSPADPEFFIYSARKAAGLL